MWRPAIGRPTAARPPRSRGPDRWPWRPVWWCGSRIHHIEQAFDAEADAGPVEGLWVSHGPGGRPAWPASRAPGRSGCPRRAGRTGRGVLAASPGLGGHAAWPPGGVVPRPCPWPAERGSVSARSWPIFLPRDRHPLRCAGPWRRILAFMRGPRQTSSGPSRRRCPEPGRPGSGSGAADAGFWVAVLLPAAGPGVPARCPRWPVRASGAPLAVPIRSRRHRGLPRC